MRISTYVAFACFLTILHSWAQDTPFPEQSTATHRFQQVAPNVYFVTGTGSVFVQSNCLVIVNDKDVIVVDSHVTPAAARALLDSIKTITDKPVRFLVNSHYHFDHAHGNQVFPEAFPQGVSIVGHEYTRTKLSGDVLNEPTYLSFTDTLPAQIDEMKARLASLTNAQERERLQAQIDVQTAHVAALKEIVPTPPDLTLREFLAIHRGDREIQLHFLGRGHTGGDVVVFLPKERLVFTGDLFLPFLSYAGDAFVNEWIDTLEKLKALDFDLMLPGHGAPIRGKEVIGFYQDYLRDLWSKVSSARSIGLSAEDAATGLDLTRHREHFPQLTAPGADVRAVRRIYQLLNAPED